MFTFYQTGPVYIFWAKSRFKITKTCESAQYDVITSQNVCETRDDHEFVGFNDVGAESNCTRLA